MSVSNNGSIFARCASKRCNLRVWLRPCSGRWRRAVKAEGAESDEPLSSGTEDEQQEETIDPRHRLLSLEESQERLREARAPEAPAASQKRWGRVQRSSPG